MTFVSAHLCETAGVYECEFTSGSFSHTATTVLRVAPLPEEILMRAKPVTVDCSKRPSTENVTVAITATVRNDNEAYQVSWSYRGGDEMQCKIDINIFISVLLGHVGCHGRGPKKSREAREAGCSEPNPLRKTLTENWKNYIEKSPENRNKKLKAVTVLFTEKRMTR